MASASMRRYSINAIKESDDQPVDIGKLDEFMRTSTSSNLQPHRLSIHRRPSSKAIFVDIPAPNSATSSTSVNSIETPPPFAVARRSSCTAQRITELERTSSASRLPSAYVVRAFSPTNQQQQQSSYLTFGQTLIDAEKYRYNPDIIPIPNPEPPTQVDIARDTEKQARQISPVAPSRFPLLGWITFGNLLVCILISVLAVELYQNGGFSPLNINPLFGVSIDTLADLGGTVTVWIRINPKAHWYRLITSSFLHSGIIHLLVNSAALLVICPKLSTWFGPIRLTVIYVIAMVGGQITTTALHVQNVVVVGASGAISGLIGAILAENIVNWRVINHPKFQLGYWLLQLLIYLLVGLLPNVDNLAHIGGLIAGFGAGLILAKRIGGYPYHKPWISTAFSVIGIVMIFWIYVGGSVIIAKNSQLQSKNLCYAFLSTNC
ncbi:hypothetical protein HDU97_008167 [Phlyctochytrium planicorne]|nr:hypothetical protein HDU97_008167 [Phlyctochytrium planicorne]